MMERKQGEMLCIKCANELQNGVLFCTYFGRPTSNYKQKNEEIQLLRTIRLLSFGRG